MKKMVSIFLSVAILFNAASFASIEIENISGNIDFNPTIESEEIIEVRLLDNGELVSTTSNKYNLKIFNSEDNGSVQLKKNSDAEGVFDVVSKGAQNFKHAIKTPHDSYVIAGKISINVSDIQEVDKAVRIYNLSEEISNYLYKINKKSTSKKPKEVIIYSPTLLESNIQEGSIGTKSFQAPSIYYQGANGRYYRDDILYIAGDIEPERYLTGSEDLTEEYVSTALFAMGHMGTPGMVAASSITLFTFLFNNDPAKAEANKYRRIVLDAKDRQTIKHTYIRIDGDYSLQAVTRSSRIIGELETKTGDSIEENFSKPYSETFRSPNFYIADQIALEFSELQFTYREDYIEYTIADIYFKRY